MRLTQVGPSRGGKEQLERNRYTEPDPLLGWRKRPGAWAVYDRRDFQTRYRVNRSRWIASIRPVYHSKPS